MTTPDQPPVAAIDVARYDRAPILSPAERAALAFVVDQRARVPDRGHWPRHVRRDLARLLTPVANVMAALGITGTLVLPQLFGQVEIRRWPAPWQGPRTRRAWRSPGSSGGAAGCTRPR